MKIEALVEMAKRVLKEKGNIEIPLQIVYEKLYKDSEINKDFIRKFNFYDDLFEYLCSELQISETNITEARICFEIVEMYFKDWSNEKKVKEFLNCLSIAKIQYKEQK